MKNVLVVCYIQPQKTKKKEHQPAAILPQIQGIIKTNNKRADFSTKLMLVNVMFLHFPKQNGIDRHNTSSSVGHIGKGIYHFYRAITTRTRISPTTQQQRQLWLWFVKINYNVITGIWWNKSKQRILFQIFGYKRYVTMVWLSNWVCWPLVILRFLLLIFYLYIIIIYTYVHTYICVCTSLQFSKNVVLEIIFVQSLSKLDNSRQQQQLLLLLRLLLLKLSDSVQCTLLDGPSILYHLFWYGAYETSNKKKITFGGKTNFGGKKKKEN